METQNLVGGGFREDIANVDDSVIKIQNMEKQYNILLTQYKQAISDYKESLDQRNDTTNNNDFVALTGRS